MTHPILCGIRAICGRPLGHKGHHGGWRTGLNAIAPDPVHRSDFLGVQLGDRITLRELDVAVAIIRHGRQKEAAAALGISERTVKAHVNAILTKTGASSMHQVPYLLGWVTLPGEDDGRQRPVALPPPDHRLLGEGGNR